MLRSLRHLVLVLSLVPFSLIACDDTSEPAAAPKAETSSAGKVTGNTYVNKVGPVSLEFLPDSKAKLTDEGKTFDITWESDGPDKLVITGVDGFRLLFTINAEGNLSDGMGGIYHKK